LKKQQLKYTTEEPQLKKPLNNHNWRNHWTTTIDSVRLNHDELVVKMTHMLLMYEEPKYEKNHAVSHYLLYR